MKKFLLIPTCATLAGMPLVALSACTIHTGGGDSPTPDPEQLEMIVIKSSDTIVDDKPITITIESSTHGDVKVTSAEALSEGFITTFEGNKVSITANSSIPTTTKAVVWKINATCDGKQMEEQNVTLIASSTNYKYLSTAGYVDDARIIYTKKSNAFDPGDSLNFAIEHNLSYYKDETALINSMNHIALVLNSQTTYEIGQVPDDCKLDNCEILSNGQTTNISAYVHPAYDEITSTFYGLYAVDANGIKEQLGHSLSLNDSIVIYIKIVNTGNVAGDISTIYY